MDKENNLENNNMDKLKRLEIEEEVITKSLMQLQQTETNGDDDADPNYPNSDLTEYITKSKHDLRDINHLFNDIKFRITFQEIDDLDVDDVKRDIIDLETRIKNFQSSAKTGLAELIEKENELITNNYDNNIDINSKPGTSDVQIYDRASVKGIVSSPVRLLIDSPFKCPEVQQLQEFLKNSKNKYGGWSFYSHNIFATIWEKYFHSELTNQKCYNSEDSLIQSDKFKYFQHDILHKISDLTKEEIISHTAWYWKYLDLKAQQKQALTNWKKNKNLINMAHSDKLSKMNMKNLNATDAGKLNTFRSNSFKSRVENKSGYTKSTIQWSSKCYTIDDQYTSHHLHLDQIKKLGVPLWRQSL